MSDIETTLPEEKKIITAEERRALFQAVDEVNSREDELYAQLEKLKASKQEKLAQIAELIGHGPFNYRGKVLAIRRGLGRGKNNNYSLIEQKIKTPEEI